MNGGHVRRIGWVALVALVMSVWPGPHQALAQTLSADEQDFLVRMGASSQDVAALSERIETADKEGLPTEPLRNKIREGLAKRVEAEEIGTVLGEMTNALRVASAVVLQAFPDSVGPEHDAAVILVAEAIGTGVPESGVRAFAEELEQPGAPPLSPEIFASAVRGLSFLTEAGYAVADAEAVVAEAVRQGYVGVEILDLGREAGRRAGDDTFARPDLPALREAIAVGVRPDALFSDLPDRPGTRPGDSAVRPSGPVERPVRPDTITRPERPVRSERVERPVRPGR